MEMSPLRFASVDMTARRLGCRRKEAMAALPPSPLSFYPYR